jgi:hypothetical protein
MHAAAAEDEALGDGDTMAEAEALADGDAADEAGAADADADGDAGAEADEVATEAEEAPLPEHAPSTITETSNSAFSATLRTIRSPSPCPRAWSRRILAYGLRAATYKQPWIVWRARCNGLGHQR